MGYNSRQSHKRAAQGNRVASWNFNVTAKAMCRVSRNLAGMDNRERTYLRVATLLNSAADGSDQMFRAWQTALVWGDGKGTSDYFDGKNLPNEYVTNGTEALVRQAQLTVEQTISAMQQYAASAGERKLPPTYRAILDELQERMTSPTSSSSWLTSQQIDSSPFRTQSDYILTIGRLTDGTSVAYSGEGSMVTIAPPGSGKTQCNVYPNLLSWGGPAVVLDISGDIYEHTAGWRMQNVGPVFKFNPLDPENSHHFNPLTSVRRDPDFLWQDARLLAEMMIVPSSASDPFWENEARTVLTAAIAYVCYFNPPEDRPMRDMLDILFGGEAWDQMLMGLQMATDVHVMTQHATALQSMNEKTLSSVLQTARSSLSAWTGERVARATSRSDWSPQDLRGPGTPTIYIYMRPNEVEAHLSLLRVFIGQHIRALTGGEVPPHGAPPILFMLDELPRLKNMPPIDEALNIGRKYGLRLWMFAQSVGQFETAYDNAQGMLSACAVRIFMNTTGADGLADKLSEELGYVESLHDNSRRKLVEAAELAGPAYEGWQIVMPNGGRPALASKDFAVRDPELSRRMELSADAVFATER